MTPDPYQVLGVSRSASAAEIRKNFRRLAKAHHPDHNPGDKVAEESFKRASGAFEIVGDPERRRRYDAGEIDADGREIHPQRRAGPFAGEAAEFDDVELGEILGQMFGDRARNARGGRRYASKGRDLRARLELQIEETVGGAKKRVVFDNGKVLEVAIPAGLGEGSVLRLKGQGEPGAAGAGDVLIEIALAPHPIFQRRDSDLLMNLPISVPDAVLGSRLAAPTPDGVVTLRIPPGSNSGSILRLKGRGIAAEGGARGDLLARLVVMLPSEPDEQLASFCEAWRRDRPYAPPRTDGGAAL